MNKLVVMAFSFFVIFLFLISGLTSSVYTNAVNSKSNYFHLAIHNNAEFEKMAEKFNWPGNGSKDNPYIIENYNITLIMGIDGISIQNTTLHFIIRNSSIFYAYNPTSIVAAGIRLKNVSNGVIENVTFESDETGIYAENSSNITIENCKFAENGVGVFAHRSRDIEISENKFEMGEISVLIEYSVYISLFENSFKDYKWRGVYLQLTTKVRIVRNYMEPMKRRNRFDEFADAGVFVENSNFTLIEKNNIYGKYSQNNGIRILKSNNVTLKENLIMQNGHGMYFLGDEIGLIERNEISFSDLAGIGFFDSYNFKIQGNNITYNYRPERLLGSWWGYGDGIDMRYSGGNIIEGNLFAFNAMGIRDDGDSSKSNLIYNNSFFYNHGSGDTYRDGHGQAIQEYGKDLWNTSKYGNYWRDWASEEDSNHDGIVDVPYPAVRDMRPLKNPPRHYKIMPTPPRKLKIDAGTGYLNLTWLKPVGNGTSPLRGYKVYIEIMFQ